MGRLSGFSASQVRKVAESEGWRLVRQRGSHMVFRRDGSARNLTIPNHRTLKPGTLDSIIETMGLTVDEFLAIVRK